MTSAQPAPASILAPAAAPYHQRLQPSKGWTSLGLAELWEYRELLYFLIWRDIKVRYKQTALGAGWAIIQPIFTMLVFSLFFGKLAKVPSDGIPYPLFSNTALVPWTFFSQGLSQSSDSLVGSANLIGKIYFPRLAIPIGTVCAGMVDFALAFSVLLVLGFWYGVHHAQYSLAAGIRAAGSDDRARRGAVAFGLQCEVSRREVPGPVLHAGVDVHDAHRVPSSLLSGKWRTVYGLNPMAGVVEAFRWALLGTKTAPTAMIGISFGAAVVLLITGAYYFRRMEKTFADVV